MTGLLDRALAQLAVHEAHSTRRACWLARAALEQLVVELLTARGIGPQTMSERAKLSCLEGAYTDHRDMVAGIEYAWSRLSEACHQHAYELTPTHQEAGHLVGLVGKLRGQAGQIAGGAATG